jgi:hypothetical protein
MHNYCKAYHLRDLRQFPSWETRQQEDEDLTDDTIVYLWDDFTAVKSPVLPEQGVLWQAVTPEWEVFCKETLNFEIPEDLRYAYVQEEQGARDQDKGMSEESVSSGEGV